MFSTIDKTFHKHHFFSTHCKYTITKLALPQLPHCNTYHFLLLHIKFYDKQISLTNKPQPLSYQFTSSVTLRLPLQAHLNQPLKYATLLHYSHIPNTH